jgi:hypothetical protein
MIDQLQLQPEGLRMRRKRPRHYSLLFQAVLVAVVFLPKATAFAPSSTGRTSDRRILTSLTHKSRSTGSSSKQVGSSIKKAYESRSKGSTSKNVYDDDAADEGDPKQNWLKWMLEGGRSRGTHKVSLDERARVLAVFLRSE